jgi:MbtH protein
VFKFLTGGWTARAPEFQLSGPDKPGFPKNGFGLSSFFATMISMNDSEQDQIVYKVVINHEEQYSIWPADRANPPGWRDAGKQGLKPECLAYIKEVWTDMRPLSLRKQMDAAQGA